jgi:hypothetical protein
MAGRPEKHTVDFFPHDANAGKKKTLTILFNHFGHEGISAWWLLLEELSTTENHVIAIRNTEDIEYLAAKLHFQPEKLKLILDKMAALEAIDRELYQDGTIWSQNFVMRLKTVYDNRKQELPRKPLISTGNNSISTGNNSIVNPSKYTKKESKESKETKERKRKEIQLNLPEIIDIDLWNSFMDIRKEKKAVQTEHALKLIIKSLVDFSIAGQDPNEILKMSIKNSWKDVYALKDGGNGQHGRIHGKMAARNEKPTGIQIE